VQLTRGYVARRRVETPPEPDPEPSLAGLLTPGYSAILVSAVMVPVTGAVVRWVAFFPVFEHPAQLAVTLPPGELALFGIIPVLATILLVALSVIVALGLRRVHQRLGIAAMVVAALFFAALAATGFLVALPYIALAVIAYYLAQRIAWQRPFRTAVVAAALVIAFVSAGIATGLRTTPSEPGRYEFASRVSISDGQYLEIAHDDATAWIAPCNRRGVVVRVAYTDVRSVEWRKGEGSLFEALDIFRRADVYSGCE